MIVTVTPNPSVDRTLAIPPLARGEVIRVRSAISEAGGKGINVSRALVGQGHESVAIAPLSAASAAVVMDLLGAELRLDPVLVSGALRTNLSLVEDDGTVTKVNEPGPMLTADEVDAILQRVGVRATGADWVVGSGSLPPGVPEDFYARLANVASGAGARVAIDADGAALRASVAARPALIKPNRRELEDLIGRPLATLGAVLEAAAGLVADGVGAVLVSLGPDGAAFVDGTGSSHAEGRLSSLANTVGAGDALVAGFLAAGANAGALREAVAWSVAACRSPGTRMGAMLPEDRSGVTVHSHADVDRRLAA